MKNSIKILATISIVLLLSFTTYSQTDHWSGAWNTKFGKVTISKNGKGYTGTFPKGQLTGGREQDGMLLGRYTRLERTPYESSLGKKADFRFILSADKTKFDGYHKSETDTKWGSQNWNGVKIWGSVMPVIVTPNIPIAVTPTWTGTWETKTGERFKIIDTGVNNKVIAKISIKRNGGTVKYYDIANGFFRDNNPRLFEGTTFNKNGIDVGFITIEYGLLDFNDFTGYMWFGLDDSKYNISAHRTSTAKPNMNTY